MHSNDPYDHLKGHLLKGQYQTIKCLLKENPSRREEVWYLAEAYVRLYEVDRAEELLRLWEDRLQGPADWALWCYWKAQIYSLRRENGSAFRAVEQGLAFLDRSPNMGLAVQLGIAKAELLIRSGHYGEASQILDEWVSVTPPIVPKVVHGRVLLALGELYWVKGEFPLARSYYEQALRVAGDVGHSQDIARALNGLGGVCADGGTFDEALDFYNRSLEIRLRYGSAAEVAGSLNNIAIIWWERGQLDKALAYYERSLEIEESVGNRIRISELLGNIGVVYLDMGQADRSLDYLSRSLVIKEKEDNPRSLAVTLNNIAIVYSAQGLVGKSLEIHLRVLEIHERLGHTQDIARSLSNIAEIFQLQGRLAEAYEWYKRALALQERFENPGELATTKASLGQVLYQEGRYQESLDHLWQALELDRQVGNPLQTAETLLNIGLVLEEMGSLTADSPVFEHFPPPPYSSSILGAYKLMLDSLLAQAEDNRGTAIKGWQTVLVSQGLSYTYQILAHEALAELYLQRWVSFQNTENLTALEKLLDQWESLCRSNNLTVSLCKVYLVRAKLDAALLQFQVAEERLLQSLFLAEESGLPRHKRLAEGELARLRAKMSTLASENFSGEGKEVEENSAEEILAYLRKIAQLFEE